MELTGPLKQRTNAIEIIELGETDVPDMAELTQLTRPGPFGPRTHSLGRYIGIRMDGRLAAMAGERMRFSDRVEISAVCTHPDFRGRGFGEYLVGIMVNALIQEGKVPLLHVLASNIGAIALYERLGFKAVHHGHVVFYGRSPA
jgi:predicted GNAT family acetyltransferase